MKFNDLQVGQRFKFPEPSTFRYAVTKTSARKYVDDMGTEYKVGSVNVEVKPLLPFGIDEVYNVFTPYKERVIKADSAMREATEHVKGCEPSEIQEATKELSRIYSLRDMILEYGTALEKFHTDVDDIIYDESMPDNLKLQAIRKALEKVEGLRVVTA